VVAASLLAPRGRIANLQEIEDNTGNPMRKDKNATLGQKRHSLCTKVDFMLAISC
jgi:hypothetical protein